MNRSERILEHLATALAVSRDDLARMEQVSARSIENDIKALNADLSPMAQIALDEHARYRLVVLDPVGYRERTRTTERSRQSFNDTMARQSYLLETLLMADRPQALETLAEDLRVGRSTAAADLTKLRETLSGFGVEVKARTHVGYWVEGEEFAIRQALLGTYFEHLFAGRLPTWQREAIEQVAQRHNLDPTAMRQLARWHTVMVDRARSGHVLTALPDVHDALAGSLAHRCGEELLDASRSHLPADVPDAEALFLALPVASVRSPLHDQASAVTASSIDNDLLAHRVIAQIREEMGFALALEPEDLSPLEPFIRHIAFLLNRMRYRVTLGTGIWGMRDAYPVAFRMATIAKGVIEDEFGGDIRDEELDFIAAHFQVFLDEQRRHGAHVRVALVATSGVASVRLLQVRLSALLPSDVELSIVTPPAGEEQLADFDVVIAPPGTQLQTELPVLFLREDFDQQEFINWVRRARAHARWGAQLTGLDYLVAGLATPDLFFVLTPTADYDAALAEMLDAMVVGGHIDESVRERIEARQAARSTLMSSGLGFPHVSDPTIQDVTFAVGVCARRPGEPGVRLVLMLLLPEQFDGFDELLAEFYDEIIRLAAAEELLDEISTSHSFHDYLLHFVKGKL
ncbi:BglG family transcription antiterminator [Microbacterium sp.]|uniref:BglG family transcription antiterminator n=1 Tax=Microbacterium sp. TaxID=51671 RepID=UPI003C77AE86